MRTRTAPVSPGIGMGILFTGGVLVVVFFTLYPFHFSRFDRLFHLSRYFDGVRFGDYSRCCRELVLLEPLANVLLFLPFGGGLTGLMRRKGTPWLGAFVRVLVCSAGFSLVVEVLQVFQPERTASLADLLMNSIGGCVGVLCYRAWSLWRKK